MIYNFKEMNDFEIIRLKEELEMKVELSIFKMIENKEIEKIEEDLFEVNEEIKRRNLNG